MVTVWWGRGPSEGGDVFRVGVPPSHDGRYAHTVTTTCVLVLRDQLDVSTFVRGYGLSSRVRHLEIQSDSGGRIDPPHRPRVGPTVNLVRFEVDSRSISSERSLEYSTRNSSLKRARRTIFLSSSLYFLPILPFLPIIFLPSTSFLPPPFPSSTFPPF